MAGERKRIEEIQMRKQERERAVKHKIYLIRRAAVILAAAAAVLALVFGVKSIVNSIQQKKSRRGYAHCRGGGSGGSGKAYSDSRTEN